jgi:hypothetical protein
MVILSSQDCWLQVAGKCWEGDDHVQDVRVHGTGWINAVYVQVSKATVVQRPPPTPQSYLVQAILDQRPRAGKTSFEYLVHWEGTGADENTWEPASSFGAKNTIFLQWKKAQTKAK